MDADRQLEEVYDYHAQAIFGFLMNVTRSEADTRDVLQELFIKLAKAPGMLVGVRDERAFLIRLAHNLAIDQMRRRGIREKNHHSLASETESVFVESGNPDEKAFRTALSGALDELPTEQRAVVHLKLWEGQTFDEIARALAVSANTAASRFRFVSMRLVRARTGLIQVGWIGSSTIPVIPSIDGAPITNSRGRSSQISSKGYKRLQRTKPLSTKRCWSVPSNDFGKRRVGIPRSLMPWRRGLWRRFRRT